MSDLEQRIAALPEWPDPDEPMFKQERLAWSSDAALARLALALEWINTRVPHLEGCPWRGLTRDAQGLLPDCRCGRDAMLAALEVPK
jgi:hypothetical protein